MNPEIPFLNLGWDFPFFLGHLQTSEVAQDRAAALALRGHPPRQGALPEVSVHIKGLFKGHLQETGCVTHAAQSTSPPSVAAD